MWSIIIVKTPKYVYIALLQVVSVLNKLFIWKDSFLLGSGLFLVDVKSPGDEELSLSACPGGGE